MKRFLLKIFGNSPTIQTGVFGSETAGNIQYSEDPTTIQSLSAWSEGLGGATSNATKQPALNDIQGVFKVLSSAIKNNQVSGIPLYLSTETYQIGSIVLNIEDNEPVLYYSLTANNTGNALTDDTNWANLYNYISSLISNNFVILDGSNATFSNLSSTAKNNIVNLFQIDYSAGISISSTTYTPPANGIIIGAFQSTGANSFGTFYNTTQRIAGISNGLSGQFLSTLVLVNKDEKYRFDMVNSNITFYPFKNQI